MAVADFDVDSFLAHRMGPAVPPLPARRPGRARHLLGQAPAGQTDRQGPQLPGQLAGSGSGRRGTGVDTTTEVVVLP
jgi:hypothetical protein